MIWRFTGRSWWITLFSTDVFRGPCELFGDDLVLGVLQELGTQVDARIICQSNIDRWVAVS